MTDLEGILAEVASEVPWRVDVADAAGYIRERASERELSARQVRELCLAQACIEGQEPAHAVLLEIVHEVAPKVRWPEVEQSDRAARIWAHVLSDDANGTCRLATFDGRGPMAAWLRVVAARLARRERPRADVELDPEEGLAAWWATAAAAERDLIKDMYVDRVREAFRESVSSLAQADRVLLHLHYRRGVSLENLTRVYGVHRVTLSRRLGSARKQILERAVSAMTKSTAMTEHECRSLLRTLRSRLELSFGSVSGDSSA